MWEWGIDEVSAMSAAAGVACGAAAWPAVALVRMRRRWQKAVGERGWLLERERESAARAAIVAERDRIARELHDIVSHNVSLMVVQAGAAREVLGTMPEEAEAALLAVEDAGRGAMTDLRHLLGLLAPSQNGDDEERERKADPGADREGDTDPGAVRLGGDMAELAPQPGLDRLGPLVDRISFAGLPVEVRISGEPCPLPQGVDVTAYRIVQEALTNALRHGDGGRAEVTVRYADRSLRVEVLNTGPSVLTGGDPTRPHPVPPVPRHRDGTGRGLLGLRERVAVYGGDLDARRRLGGGYRVRARIPPGPAVTGADTVAAPRVLVVDDQTLIRTGFRLILTARGIDVVGEAADGAEAVAMARELVPDVVLMDIRMPNMDGLEATRRILDRAPDCRVLMLTTFDLDRYVYAALSIGASGFLLKDVTPQHLVAAVRLVDTGDALLAPTITRRLVERFATEAAHPSVAHADLRALTPRELEVLTLLGRGLSNTELAAELTLSEATVKSHVARIFSKLGLRDRAQAVVIAYEKGLVRAAGA